MPLVSPIESRTLKGRAIHAGIILALLLITATTVYPFLVMISGSMRSEFDVVDLDLVPSFLVDEDTLYLKFLANKYDEDPQLANDALLRQGFSFKKFPLPDQQVDPAIIGEFERFLTSEHMPRHWVTLGGAFSLLDAPENLRKLQASVFDRYDGDLGALSADLGTVVEDWSMIRFSPPQWLNKGYLIREDGPIESAYFTLLEQRPAAELVPVSLSGHFLRTMVYSTYGQYSTSDYNAAHATPLASFHDFRLSPRIPSEEEPTLRKAWKVFVREYLNPSFVVVDDLTTEEYRKFLHRIGVSPDYVQTATPPDGRWLSGQDRAYFERYLAQLTDPERLRLVGPEFTWANENPDAPALTNVLAVTERQHVADHAGIIRWSYVTRNYINVWRELTVQGRVLLNTAVFCGLAIVLALLVNPLAAYAMSRFKLKATYKVLLFLIATMAFPPMVTMIPQFVMLRNLGLLNTFIALVLPLIVNGYMIFLLKGFFDALPQELYEAATIDGAGEWRMFFQITMALSKPILAILALGTFTGAYTMFLYPLLVAPDQDMWLMSVWLFQFQQRSTSAAVFASVVIASVPTMLIFLFTQRMIMRGIVIPTEK